jgi:hypothetical protein
MKKPKRGKALAAAARPETTAELIAWLDERVEAFRLTTTERRKLKIAAQLVGVGNLRRGGMIAREIAAVAELRVGAVLKPVKVAVDIGPRENLLTALWRQGPALVLSEDQQERLHDAVIAYERSPKGSPGSAMRDAALGVARGVQDELGSGLAETIALAEAKGDKVTRDNGRTRCHGRDGLAALFDAGALGAGLRPDDALEGAKVRAEAGFAYRQAHEQRGALRSQLCGEIGGQGGDPVAAGFYRAAYGHTLHSVEQQVGTFVGERALLALREVAGEGKLVSSISAGGWSMRKNTEALISALDVAAHGFWIAGAALLTRPHELA